jgi:hypothetical protein
VLCVLVEVASRKETREQGYMTDVPTRQSFEDGFVVTLTAGQEDLVAPVKPHDAASGLCWVDSGRDCGSSEKKIVDTKTKLCWKT